MEFETRFEGERAGQAAFSLAAPFEPMGDQPQAIETLLAGLRRGEGRLTLQGVTGSGKTFTMANIIQKWARPTLVISHNKTLAAQLYAELKSFFPDNAVEYFVSYYDYYQPEAYIPQTDTYIEKDASINEEIERFRLAASHSLLGRKDVVIVASVSCIYGLVSPEDYRGLMITLRPGQNIPRDRLLAQLVEIQYLRNDYQPQPGVFRVRGDTVDLFPAYTTTGIRITWFGDEIETLHELNPTTGRTGAPIPSLLISPAKQFVMPRDRIEAALDRIRAEMNQSLVAFEARGKLLEAQRLRQRTEFDVAMLKELGHCNGIENYSAPLAGRPPGEPPPTLIDYFGPDFLCIIDESHVTLPQIRAMYNGDQARKQTLVDNGFRLPSAKDNRPLTFDEFLDRTPRLLFTTATPGTFEKQTSATTAQQIIRPTGLLDPPIEIRPLANQIDNLIEEIRRVVEQGGRILVTTLTKRSSEDLTLYLREIGIRVEYLHSDIDAIERVAILGRLRKGTFDCLIGINLLREGLDLPEVTTVAVLDADKEGFLRSETSLIQTIGRCARHIQGRAILYADTITAAIQATLDTTQARRQAQQAYNQEHHITPRTVNRTFKEKLDTGYEYPGDDDTLAALSVAETSPEYDLAATLLTLEQQMYQAAEALEFERAALLRDDLKALRKKMDITKK